MSERPIPFTTRNTLVATIVGFVLLGFGAIYLLLEFYIVPPLMEEQAGKIRVLPALIATANQESIIKSDLAALKSTLDQMIANTEGSGIQYIIIQDADGKIMTAVFHRTLIKAEQEQILNAIRMMIAPRRRHGGTASNGQDVSVDAGKLTDAERAALGTSGAAVNQQASVLPPDQLPIIDAQSALALTVLDAAIIDHTMPINTGSIRFGGVRVGIRDDLTQSMRRLRIVAFSTFFLIVLVGAGTSLTVATTLDARAQKAAAGVVEAVRKEMETRIRQLEAEQHRKEEENPISPAEFLSLLDYARKISATLDYNEALHISVHTCLQVMNVRDCSIFVLDVTTNELVGRVGHDENGLMDEEEMARIRVPVGKGDIGAAAEFGTTTTIDTPRPGAAVVSALVARGRTIGVILVRNKLNGRPFIKKDQTLLRIFSGLLANSMENAAIYHHLNRA
jgi:hypothetical protein